MSKRKKREQRARRAIELANALTLAADALVAEAQRECDEAILSAEETLAALEYDVAVMQAQDIPMGARH